MELVQIYYLKKNYSYYRYQFGNFLAFSQPWWWPMLWSHNTDAGYGISGTGDRELSAQREICRDPLPWTCLIVVLFHLRLRGWICVELKQKKRAGRNRKLNTSHLQWVKMPRDARGNAQSRPRGFHERCQVRGFREGTRHWRNHQLQLEAGPAVSKGGPNSIGGTVTDHKSIPLQGQARFPQPLSAVCAATLGICIGCLGPLDTSGHTVPGVSPAEGRQSHFWTQSKHIWREAQGAGDPQPAGEKGRDRHVTDLQNSERNRQRWNASCGLKGPTAEGQPGVTHRSTTWCREENIFQLQVSWSMEQPGSWNERSIDSEPVQTPVLAPHTGSSGTRQDKLKMDEQTCHTARTFSSGSSVDQRGLHPKYESTYRYQDISNTGTKIVNISLHSFD